MIRKCIFFVMMITASLQLWAKDDVTLKASAPDVVVNGDQFRLTYTVNSQDVKGFLAPQANGFDVLMGPSRSQQSSTQIINGKVSSSRSITYTYILMAVKEGTFTIPSASIECDGEKIFSNPLTIKVLPKDKEDAQSGAQGGAQSGSSSRSQAAGSRITDKDLFVLATASKTKVHEQEAVLLTYKAYTTVDLRQLLGKMSDQQGFYIQEVELPAQKTFKLEHYKGRNYNTVVYRQYVLFPQKSGKIEIPPVTFDAVVAQRVATSDDPFEAFFNGGGYVEVQKKIVAPKVVLDVKALPTKPEGFSGGVGDFKMDASISTTELKANDAVTVKLTLAGTGNMKLVAAPEVKFPADFEVYDPKITDNFELTANGLTGSKTIEYLAIPRHAGDFTIPAVEFKYFDIKSEQYKTLKSDVFQLKVAKGEGSGNSQKVIADFTNKENVKVLGTDILFIKTGDTTLREKGKYFYGTTSYWLWYIIPLVVFVVFVVAYRKQAVENANVAKMKTKKANKVAAKRMKLAGRLLAENKSSEFYDEVLKTLWGYISDKFNIPVSQLTKDNVEAKLTDHGVSAQLIGEFLAALNECEFARYAPGNQNEAMDKVYSTAVDVISKMENSIKKKSGVSMILVLLFACLPFAASAATDPASVKADADKAYQENNFKEAIQLYESIVESGLESSVVYYNLGNSYYKDKNIAKAVLNYERALLLSPGNEDIKYNLEMAKSKTVDKITPKSEVFIITWTKGVRDIMGESAWAKLAVCCFILFLLSVAAYIFGNKVVIKKIGFSFAVVFLVVTVASNMFADSQKDKLVNRTGAIIMTPSVTVKSTPDESGTDLFVLHEGSKVFIDDDSMKTWKEVQLEDGSKGWVPAECIEII